MPSQYLVIVSYFPVVYMFQLSLLFSVFSKCICLTYHFSFFSSNSTFRKWSARKLSHDARLMSSPHIMRKAVSSGAVFGTQTSRCNPLPEGLSETSQRFPSTLNSSKLSSFSEKLGISQSNVILFIRWQTPHRSTFLRLKHSSLLFTTTKLNPIETKSLASRRGYLSFLP